MLKHQLLTIMGVIQYTVLMFIIGLRMKVRLREIIVSLSNIIHDLIDKLIYVLSI